MALIELGSPELLLLAPLFITLTLIGHYFAHRIKRGLEVFHFPPIQRLSRIVVKKGLRRSRWRSISLALKLVIIILITFVLADPTLLTFGEVRETVEVPMAMEKDVAGQIILTIDVSASMGLGDVLPSRLGVAKRILTEFVQNASDSVRFGIVAFESQIVKALPPTKDKNLVVSTIQNLTYAEGLPCLEEYTDIGHGLQVSADILVPYASSNKSSAIILVSDGFANYGSPNPFGSVLIGAQRANDIGVSIHALHVGSLGQDSNDELMKEIANETNGKYMDSSSSDQLREVLSLLGKYYVPTHEWSSKVEITTTVPVRIELGFILMFVASAFLLALWVGNYGHYKTAF
jgi:Mg-chelatase subunit ChlD